MTEREFWVLFRRCLLMLADAIAKRYELDKYAPPKIVPIREGDTIT